MNGRSLRRPGVELRGWYEVRGIMSPVLSFLIAKELKKKRHDIFHFRIL